MSSPVHSAAGIHLRYLRRLRKPSAVAITKKSGDLLGGSFALPKHGCHFVPVPVGAVDQTKPVPDRYIPFRSDTAHDYDTSAALALGRAKLLPEKSSDFLVKAKAKCSTDTAFPQALAMETFGVSTCQRETQIFKVRSSTHSVHHLEHLYKEPSASTISQHTRRLLSNANDKTQERIVSCQKPWKILDAPELTNDFYTHAVTWSSSSNLIAVALSDAIHMIDGNLAKKWTLFDYENEIPFPVTAIEFSPLGNHLVVGWFLGSIDLWDVAQNTLVNSVQYGSNQKDGVTAMTWNPQMNQLLVSGHRDGSLFMYDVRTRKIVSSVCVRRHLVCGLKWSFDGCQLASGGNDDKILIWDNRNLHKPVLEFTQHKAAVKALAWSPHQSGLLASGGGTLDKNICLWNTLSGSAKGCVETGSPVCNLVWSTNTNEIVSTHGFSSSKTPSTTKNYITCWSYPTMQRVMTLEGHTERILQLALSPNGQTILTGAGGRDESLRFWNLFPERSRKNSRLSLSRLLSVSDLR